MRVIHQLPNGTVGRGPATRPTSNPATGPATAGDRACHPPTAPTHTRPATVALLDRRSGSERRRPSEADDTPRLIPRRRPAQRIARALALVAALAASAAALSACGSDNRQDQVVGALQGWYGAVAAGNGHAACQHLTSHARAQFLGAAPGASCEAKVALVSHWLTDAQWRALINTKIARVQVDGDRASIEDRDVQLDPAVRRYADPNDRPTLFRHTNGHWLIDDLG